MTNIKEVETYRKLSSILCYSKFLITSKNISKTQLKSFISKCEAEHNRYKDVNNHIVKGLIVDLRKTITRLQEILIIIIKHFELEKAPLRGFFICPIVFMGTNYSLETESISSSRLLKPSRRDFEITS